MIKQKPTYEELSKELKQTRDMLDAIQRGETDAIVSQNRIMVLRIRELEEKRERLLMTLEGKNRELERFTKVIRHDFSNNVLSVEAFAMELELTCRQMRDILENRDSRESAVGQVLTFLDDDIPSSLGFILSAVKQMRSMLEGLRRIAAVGRFNAELQRIDVDQLAREVVGMMKHQFKDIQASVEQDKLPECIADEGQLKEVFNNLLTNAVKYRSPDRPLIIKITGKRQAGSCTYCIKDNGIGIQPQNLEKIFEIFHRENENAAEGDGIGLSLVSQMLARQHGRVWTESEYGKGSRFFFSLPNATEKNKK